jgi:hypothetical protein
MTALNGLITITGELPEKSAGIVEDAYRSSFVQKLKDGAGAAGEGLMDAGGRMKDWYDSLNPEMRSAVLRGTAGAAGGAAIGGGLNYFQNRHRDPEDRTSSLSPALLGALLGGGAAAALPAGLSMLSGKTRFPGEKKPSVVSKALGVLPVRENPLATAGLTAGALYRHRNAEILKEVMQKRAPKVMSPLLTSPRSWKGIKQRLKPGRLAEYGRLQRDVSRFKPVAKAVDKLHPTLTGAQRAKKIFHSRLGRYGIPIGLLAGILGDSVLKGRMD